MVKYIGLLLTLVCIVSSAQGQYVRRDHVDRANRAGLKGGFNFSSIDSDLGANTATRRGFNASLYYKHYLGKKFAIQPELQYSREGWVRELQNEDIEAELHYANITAVGKYHLIRGFNLEGGVMAAILLDGIEENDGVLALDRRLNRFNFGVVFGFGYDFPFGLTLGGRLIQGLVDINDGYNASSVNNEIKTINYQVYLGYGFDLSGLGNKYR